MQIKQVKNKKQFVTGLLFVVFREVVLCCTKTSDATVGTIGIDNLSYGYQTNSNKLALVYDSSNNTSGFNDGNTTGDDYTYDDNGNLTTDKNKEITSISYNYLNLPTEINFGSSFIRYIYDALGTKLKKIVLENTDRTETCYAGGFQYVQYFEGGLPSVLQFFSQPEGYVEPDGSPFKYVYQYKDHLGNVRLSYTKNSTTGLLEIVEESNYYPFGLTHNGYNGNNAQPDYKYKYNGKELQDELGLNMYDYGARNYDPALGCWMNVDPLAEKMRRWSPYNYCFDNPMRFIDPDGMGPDDWIEHLDSNGYTAVTYHQGIETKEQATAAGYSGVAKVFKSGTIEGTAPDGSSYSYSLNANATVTNSEGQTTDQGFSTPNGTYVSENPIGRANMFLNGAKNTTLGVVGSIGAIAAIPETAGTSTVALTLTTAATGIGFGQMLNAFQTNVDGDLQSFSTLLGLGAARAGNQYAPLVDGLSNWATGSLTDPRMLGNTIGTYKSLQGLNQGNNIFMNSVSLYGSYDAVSGVTNALNNPKK